MLLITFFSFSQISDVDLGYLSGDGFDIPSTASAMQSDGKILFGGGSNVVRVNIDGSIDNTFNSGSIPGVVFDIAIQADEKIVIAGSMTGDVIRLNGDGTVDNTFSLDGTGITGGSDAVYAVDIQADGKIILGGDFGDYNGTSRTHVLRLNTDGSLDATFDPGIGPNAPVRDIEIQDDGKIVIVGDFVTYQGQTNNKVVRLESDGSIDTSFGLNFSLTIGRMYKVLIQPDGKILMGGFGTNGSSSLMYRLQSDGTQEFGIGVLSGLEGTIIGIELIDGGKIAVAAGSTLELFSGDDGSPLTFMTDLGEGFDGAIGTIITDSQDQLVVAGSFDHFDGYAQNGIARLQSCSSIELTEFIATEDINTCENDNTTLSVTATGTNLTYQWQVNTNNGAGLFTALTDAGIYSGTTTSSLTLTGVTAAEVANKVFRCEITDANCQTISNEVVITANAQQVITTQPENTSVCEGETAQFTVANEGANGSYQWQVDDGSGFVDLVSNGIEISGANSTTLSIIGTTLEMEGNNYRVVLSDCNTPVISNSATLSITPKPLINELDETQRFCVTGDADFTVDVEGSGITYQWQYRTNLGTPIIFADLVDGGEVAGAQTATLSITGANNTFDKLYVVESDGSGAAMFRCKVTQNGCETFTNATKLFQVNPTATVLVQPVAESGLCDNGQGVSTSFTTNAEDSNGLFQWQVDDGGGFVNIEDDDIYSGSTGLTLSLTNATTALDGYIFRCEIGGCSPSVYTDEVVLSIGETPVITAEPIQMDVCEGVDVEYSVTATGTDLSYQWQERVSGGSYVDLTDAGKYFGTGSEVLQISEVNTGMDNNFYRCVISSGDCSVTSAQRILNVFDAPSFTGAPADQTVCEGGDVVFSRSAFNFSGNVHAYQWQEALPSLPDIFVDLTESNKYVGTNTFNLGIIGSTISMDGNRYRLKITGCGEDIFSDPATLNINQLPIISESPLPQTVCVGENASFSVDAIGTDLIYEWQVKTTDATEFSIVTSNTTGDLDVSAIASLDGAVYKCVVRPADPCDSQEQAVESIEAMLTVNEVSITTQPVSNVSVCAGENTTISIAASGEQLTYQWSENGVEISDDDTFSGSTTNSLSITAASGSLNQNVYRCTISGLCDPVESTTTTLFVTSVDKPEIVEVNSGGTIILQSSISASAYEWYLNGNNISTDTQITPEEEGNYTLIVSIDNCFSEESDAYVFAPLGVNTLNEVSIYPNPTSGVLNYSSDKSVSLKLFSLSGQEVKILDTPAIQHTIDLKDLEVGQYILHVYENGKLLGTEKIIKIN